MRSCPKCSPSSVRPAAATAPGGTANPVPAVFSPAFMARLHEQDGVITAAEAEYAGPWTTAAVPGRPGEVGVVRVWESPAAGDLPRGAFRHEEVAKLFAAALPLVGREPLFLLGETAGEQGVPGYPVTAIEGEDGLQVCGWLQLFELEVVATAHILQALVRNPAALALVLEAAGGGALGQVDRILGRQLEVEE
jgi:hypothetical protein